MDRKLAGFIILLFSTLTVIISNPAMGSEHAESLENVNFLDILSTVVDWIAILLEEAAKGVREGWDFIMEILNRN
jgi:hypothetical protein